MAFPSVPASSQTALPERISPQEAAKRIEACGVGPVTIRFDDLLQSHVLTISNAASSSDEQLHCIDRAASYHDVELPAPVQVRFDAIRQKRWSAYAVAEARSWLTQRGLLDKVPTFVPGKTDETAFARQLEELCGPTARGAFQSSYGPHVISPEWIMGLGMPPKAKNQEALTCLLNVTTIAGFSVGFIGNEAYADEK
jgi:hypothetical protein